MARKTAIERIAYEKFLPFINLFIPFFLPNVAAGDSGQRREPARVTHVLLCYSSLFAYTRG